jgi:hypothetical protein
MIGFHLKCGMQGLNAENNITGRTELSRILLPFRSFKYGFLAEKPSYGALIHLYPPLQKGELNKESYFGFLG